MAAASQVIQSVGTNGQIGTVTMPFDGHLSAAIYDASGQIVRTLLAQSPQKAGTVTLTWDGKDYFGRTVVREGDYTKKAVFSQVSVTDQGGVGDSLFSPEHLANFPYTLKGVAVDPVGVIGHVGGIFARNVKESYFGDTELDRPLTLGDTIKGSGMFSVSEAAEMDGTFFLGHFSSGATTEFIGLQFKEGDVDGMIKVAARMYKPDGGGCESSESITLYQNTGYYNFEYTYDPAYEGNANHEGQEGRLTVRIYSGNLDKKLEVTPQRDLGGLDAALRFVVLDKKLEIALQGDQRDSKAQFDAFGVGINGGTVGSNDPKKTARLALDDVRYSGKDGTVDFTKDPGWQGSGDAEGGNRYGWNHSSIGGDTYLVSSMDEGPEIQRLTQAGGLVWEAGDWEKINVASDGK